jgi:hypothetical protein
LIGNAEAVAASDDVVAFHLPKLRAALGLQGEVLALFDAAAAPYRARGTGRARRRARRDPDPAVLSFKPPRSSSEVPPTSFFWKRDSSARAVVREPPRVDRTARTVRRGPVPLRDLGPDRSGDRLRIWTEHDPGSSSTLPIGGALFLMADRVLREPREPDATRRSRRERSRWCSQEASRASVEPVNATEGPWVLVSS